MEIKIILFIPAWCLRILRRVNLLKKVLFIVTNYLYVLRYLSICYNIEARLGIWTVLYFEWKRCRVMFSKEVKAVSSGETNFFLTTPDISAVRKSTRGRGRSLVTSSRSAHRKIGNVTMDEETQQHKHDRSRDQRMVNLTNNCRGRSFLEAARSSRPSWTREAAQRASRRSALPFPL